MHSLELNVFSLDVNPDDVAVVMSKYDEHYCVDAIKHSNVFIGIRRTSLESLAERFWSKVEKTDGCWIWKANLHKQGYGFFKIGQKNYLAHRVAYALVTGEELDPEIKLLHSCDNTSCVNPMHLSKGTQRENVMDMVNKGRHVGCSKLTDDQVRAIRIDQRPQRVIEAEYGVALGTVSKIKSGKRYKRVSQRGTQDALA